MTLNLLSGANTAPSSPPLPSSPASSGTPTTLPPGIDYFFCYEYRMQDSPVVIRTNSVIRVPARLGAEHIGGIIATIAQQHASVLNPLAYGPVILFMMELSSEV